MISNYCIISTDCRFESIKVIHFVLFSGNTRASGALLRQTTRTLRDEGRALFSGLSAASSGQSRKHTLIAPIALNWLIPKINTETSVFLTDYWPRLFLRDPLRTVHSIKILEQTSMIFGSEIETLIIKYRPFDDYKKRTGCSRGFPGIHCISIEEPIILYSMSCC